LRISVQPNSSRHQAIIHPNANTGAPRCSDANARTNPNTDSRTGRFECSSGQRLARF